KSKYVLALFIDIEGAFDNLWWQAILATIRKSECSSTLYQIIRGYFTNRHTIVRSKTDQIERSMERGCPQGSILGPIAWNWCMDELLTSFKSEFDEAKAEIIAYADDLLILIKEDSRRNL
ncbi:Putative 115 kDa protein in type-1 retrotransposable element R1DM, partial [Camponotus floridanus]